MLGKFFNIHYVFFYVLIAFYYGYFLTVDSYVHSGGDLYIYLSGFYKVSMGLVPSVDFITPLGILNYQLFDFFYDINPAGASTLSRLPFFVVFSLYLWHVRKDVSISCILFLMAFAILGVLHKLIGLKDLPAGGWENSYIEIGILMYLSALCVTLKRHITYTDMLILGVLIGLSFFVKASHILIFIPLICVLLVYHRLYISHAIVIMCAIIGVFLLYYIAYRPYIDAYILNLSWGKLLRGDGYIMAIILDYVKNVISLLIILAVIIFASRQKHRYGIYHICKSIFIFGCLYTSFYVIPAFSANLIPLDYMGILLPIWYCQYYVKTPIYTKSDNGYRIAIFFGVTLFAKGYILAGHEDVVYLILLGISIFLSVSNIPQRYHAVYGMCYGVPIFFMLYIFIILNPYFLNDLKYLFEPNKQKIFLTEKLSHYDKSYWAYRDNLDLSQRIEQEIYNMVNNGVIDDKSPMMFAFDMGMVDSLFNRTPNNYGLLELNDTLLQHKRILIDIQTVLFKDIKYIGFISPNITQDLYMLRWQQVFKQVFKAYISDNFTPLHTENLITIYMRK